MSINRFLDFTYLQSLFRRKVRVVKSTGLKSLRNLAIIIRVRVRLPPATWFDRLIYCRIALHRRCRFCLQTGPPVATGSSQEYVEMAVVRALPRNQGIVSRHCTQATVVHSTNYDWHRSTSRPGFKVAILDTFVNGPECGAFEVPMFSAKVCNQPSRPQRSITVAMPFESRWNIAFCTINQRLRRSGNGWRGIYYRHGSCFVVSARTRQPLSQGKKDSPIAGSAWKDGLQPV